MVRAGKTPQICKGNGDQTKPGKLHHPLGACVVVLRASLGRPLSVKSHMAKATTADWVPEYWYYD